MGLIAAAAVALGACSRDDVGSAPAPAAVEPSTGQGDRPVPVIIRGERFYVRPVQDASGARGTIVDARFRAWLGATKLEAVTWVDERTLRAVVPAGIPFGRHALTVEDPFGRQGTLADAYEVQEATLLVVDPFGDGTTSFAFVTAYGGDLVIGPSRHGMGLVRMAPDGTAAQSLSLSFAPDVSGGNLSSNKATPYTSIGYSGCTKDVVVNACGPDNEDGRGILSSFTFGGEEWLLLGGARSAGDLDYVYVTRDTGTALSFWYLDLSLFLGGNTRGISAVREIGGRLYVGFPDNGGNRPYGVSVLRLPAGGPTEPGIDAIAGDAINLQLDEALKVVPGVKFDTISMVDAIGELGGRIYFLNDVGCIVSRTAAPATFSDFANCSPAAGPAYDRNLSLAPPRQYDLEPRDKAWPQVAVWNGRLYAIRNLEFPTTPRQYAPQLWSCDPAGGPDPVACDPGDWSIVAADASGLTRFGNPNATAATLLVATARHLYVGFDDTVGGVRIYRTSAPVPRTASDFEGSGGCNAADAACPGFGGNGLGDPQATTRVLDAKEMELGGAIGVYLTAGNGVGPVRLVRLPE